MKLKTLNRPLQAYFFLFTETISAGLFVKKTDYILAYNPYNPIIGKQFSQNENIFNSILRVVAKIDIYFTFIEQHLKGGK